MNIGIITIHNIPNFGSIFQSYALSKYLINQGYNVELIDYNPKYFKPHTFKTIVAALLNARHYLVRNKKFRNFIIRNIPISSESSTNINELNMRKYDYDVYISGGDQLWNVYYACGNDDAYKLTWVDGKKISYSTSLGQKDFPEDKIDELVSKLESYSSVSVREKSSVKLLSDKGINAVQCVDPVFLLEKKEYEKFLKPIDEDKYLLVYLVSPSDLLDRCIDFIANYYGLKVILCSGFSKKCRCDKFYKDLGPDEILSYINNAEIVLSSSFHASAFSIMFKKQFFVILPGEHTNERIEDWLSICNLSEQIIKDDTDIIDILTRKIDYQKIKSYDGLVNDSKAYIERALENDK